jgi:hypothetical protein
MLFVLETLFETRASKMYSPAKMNIFGEIISYDNQVATISSIKSQWNNGSGQRRKMYWPIYGGHSWKHLPSKTGVKSRIIWHAGIEVANLTFFYQGNSSRTSKLLLIMLHLLIVMLKDTILGVQRHGNAVNLWTRVTDINNKICPLSYLCYQTCFLQNNLQQQHQRRKYTRTLQTQRKKLKEITN